jgi:FKBP-type peptidyl-prolyl cis-trans isomerase
MKRITIPLMAAALMLSACNNKTPKLNDLNDTLSWALGENFALTLKQSQVTDINEDLVVQALRHTLADNPKLIDDTTYFLAIQYIINQQQQANRQQQQTADPKKVTTDQEAYLANLEANNPKVKKHPAGFYYEVLREGKGPKANYAQRIRFDYRSYLMLTGEPYDQTYGKREPIIHVIGNPMFPGLIEGLQLMNAGSIYRFYFPYQLAFGEHGSGDIPGYTPFIYEVELHELYND